MFEDTLIVVKHSIDVISTKIVMCSGLQWYCTINIENSDDPDMQHTMNVENISPNGKFGLLL